MRVAVGPSLESCGSKPSDCLPRSRSRQACTPAHTRSTMFPPACLPACLPALQLCAKNPACGAYVWNPYFSLVCVLKVREEGRCRSTPTPVGCRLQAPACLCACIRSLHHAAGPDHPLHALLHHITHPGRPCWPACLTLTVASLHHHFTTCSPPPAGRAPRCKRITKASSLEWCWMQAAWCRVAASPRRHPRQRRGNGGSAAAVQPGR